MCRQFLDSFKWRRGNASAGYSRRRSIELFKEAAPARYARLWRGEKLALRATKRAGNGARLMAVSSMAGNGARGDLSREYAKNQHVKRHHLMAIKAGTLSFVTKEIAGICIFLKHRWPT